MKLHKAACTRELLRVTDIEFRGGIEFGVGLPRRIGPDAPFVWTADPDRVLAAISRGKQTLESVN